MRLDDIKLNPGNPRLIKDDRFKKLVASIKDFPAMMELRPIVVNADMMILGGNMRYRACKELGMKEIPDNWVKVADSLTEEEQQRFIVEDNVPFGEWNWDVLANEWDTTQLEEWGVELPQILNPDELSDQFTLPDGDKAPFQQMTFTLADGQATVIQNALADAKHTEEYKYIETMGNENSNGNALYLIVSQWAGQRT